MECFDYVVFLQIPCIGCFLSVQNIRAWLHNLVGRSCICGKVKRAYTHLVCASPNILYTCQRVFNDCCFCEGEYV